MYAPSPIERQAVPVRSQFSQEWSRITTPFPTEIDRGFFIVAG
jgi:hypothetical protein